MKKQYQKKFDKSAAKNFALIDRIQTLKERYQASEELDSEIESEEGAEAGQDQPEGSSRKGDAKRDMTLSTVVDDNDHGMNGSVQPRSAEGEGFDAEGHHNHGRAGR
jgi:hypothetical protein